MLDVSWLDIEKEVEVWSEACVQDGRADVRGMQGSWRRAKVIRHTHGSITSLTACCVEVVLRLGEGMYDDDDDTIEVFEEPFEVAYLENTSKAAKEDYMSRTWLVAPKSLRPYLAFQPHWPEHSIDAFAVGDRVLYVDGTDECIRWVAYVRKVFADGLWVYVPGSVDWDAHEHHCLVARRGAPLLSERFTMDPKIKPVPVGFKVKRAYCMDRHLRRDREWDARAAVWRDGRMQQRFFEVCDPPVSREPLAFYDRATWFSICEEGPARAPKHGKASKKRKKSSLHAADDAPPVGKAPKTASSAAASQSHAVPLEDDGRPSSSNRSHSDDDMRDSRDPVPWKVNPQPSRDTESRIRRVLKEQLASGNWLEDIVDDPETQDMLLGFMRAMVGNDDNDFAAEVLGCDVLEALTEDLENATQALRQEFAL